MEVDVLKTTDMSGQPCPIPVISAKKALTEPGADGVSVLVDNITAVRNLGKMAAGSGYGFPWEDEGSSRCLVTIASDMSKSGAPAAIVSVDSPGADAGVMAGKARACLHTRYCTKPKNMT